MILDGKDAERIAKDVIQEIASEWIDTPISRCIKENDSYIFEYTVAPTSIIRYARDVERPPALSVFRFDPLAEVTEIVINCANNLQQDEVSDVALNAKPRVLQMLISAPGVFAEAMGQARIIGETIHGIEIMHTFGRPDIARGLLNSAMAIMERNLREKLGRIPQKQRPKISPFSLSKTLYIFLPEFRKTGQIPSQRQFAKALGVTAKGWREYLKNHRLDAHAVAVKEWLEDLLASTSDADE